MKQTLNNRRVHSYVLFNNCDEVCANNKRNWNWADNLRPRPLIARAHRTTCTIHGAFNLYWIASVLYVCVCVRPDSIPSIVCINVVSIWLTSFPFQCPWLIEPTFIFDVPTAIVHCFGNGASHVRLLLKCLKHRTRKSPKHIQVYRRLKPFGYRNKPLCIDTLHRKSNAP